MTEEALLERELHDEEARLEAQISKARKKPLPELAAERRKREERVMEMVRGRHTPAEEQRDWEGTLGKRPEEGLGGTQEVHGPARRFRTEETEQAGAWTAREVGQVQPSHSQPYIGFHSLFLGYKPS